MHSKIMEPAQNSSAQTRSAAMDRKLNENEPSSERMEVFLRRNPKTIHPSMANSRAAVKP